MTKSVLPKFFAVLILWIILISCTLSLTIPGPHHRDLSRGDSCFLQDGRNGTCELRHECDAMLDELAYNLKKVSDYNICGYHEDHYTMFCCYPESDVKALRTTTKKPKGCDDENEEDKPDIFRWHWQCVQKLWSYVPKRPSAQVYLPVRQHSKRKSETECIEYKKMRPDDRPPIEYAGLYATLGEFPHMAALKFYDDLSKNSSSFKCGGTLISNRYVLTAAHCFLEQFPLKLVRLGAVDVRELDRSYPYKDYTVENITVHESYKIEYKYYDIALLRLDQDVVFTSYIFPACLYSDADEYPETTEISASGWGKVTAHSNVGSNELLKTKLSIVSHKQCFNKFENTGSYHHNYPQGLLKSQLCAIDLTGLSDSCQGDSGGPLQIKNERKPATLIGITSFGIDCGSSYPAVYTRVASFLDWIEAIVWPN